MFKALLWKPSVTLTVQFWLQLTRLPTIHKHIHIHIYTVKQNKNKKWTSTRYIGKCHLATEFFCHVVRDTCRECVNNYAMFLLCMLFRSKELIKDAILDNDFLKKLESSQIREVVECMYEKKWKKDEFLIKEGESGSDLFVLEGM